MKSNVDRPARRGVRFRALVVLCLVALAGAAARAAESATSPNTVPGAGQIGCGRYVRFEGSGRDGGLLVVGSSYAWHAPKPEELGWNGDWGMAASAREKDCAHLLWAELRKTDPDAPLCIAQSADWERNYTGDVEILERDFASLRNLRPKWICFVTTAGNSPVEMERRCPVTPYYVNMVEWFRKLNPEAKIVVSTTSRLPRLRDGVTAWAAAHGVPVVNHDFLDTPGTGYRATGLFRHPGVAWHPSDKGFAEMARRYAEAFGVGADPAISEGTGPAARRRSSSGVVPEGCRAILKLPGGETRELGSGPWEAQGK